MLRYNSTIALIVSILLIVPPIAPQLIEQPREPIIAPLEAAPFGLNAHLATRHPDPSSMHIPANLVASLGVGWVREDFHWWRIQPTPDQRDWTFNDRAIHELSKHRLRVVGVLGHPPGWATAYPHDDQSGVSFYAPDPQRFASFAYEVVKRYGNYVRYWEIWNEPDNPLFWKPQPDPAAYASLLIQTAAAVKRASPHARILIGGLNPYDTHFLSQVAAAGAWNSFDILAIHPYVDPTSPEAGDITAVTDGVNAIATKFGAKPIWATEVGWSSGPGDHDPVGIVDEQTQADYLVRAFLLLWRAGVERTFWYTLKDDPGNPYGLVKLGKGRGDYSQLKPAFHAFRTLNQQIGGAEFVALHDLFERSTVLDFETLGTWRRGTQPYGTLSPSKDKPHSGNGSAQLSYSFPSQGNDYVVFRRERPTFIPGVAYALGLWVYGDSSGNTLKLWLRDAENEVLQYTLGAVGSPGWRLLQVQLGSQVAAWDRISDSGNGRIDFPVRVDAIVLDDGADQFIGSGILYLDDLIAFNGPEAYDLQLQQDDKTLDILWAPSPLRARITSTAASATMIERDGGQRVVTIADGKLSLNVGSSPIYIRHTR